MSPPQDTDASCPFCTIAKTYPPVNPLEAPSNPSLDPNKLVDRSHVLLSTEHVIAFLDILPLAKGHVLVAPRKHRTKIGHLNAGESSEIGRLLPMLARSITHAMMPDIPHDEVDYNIVQNNGPGAAQVIPHVHFHIIPRYPFDYKRPEPLQRSSSTTTSYRPIPLPPKGYKRSAVLFGRGQRHEIDEDEPDSIVEEMRRCVKEEWRGYLEEVEDERGRIASSTEGRERLRRRREGNL